LVLLAGMVVLSARGTAQPAKAPPPSNNKWPPANGGGGDLGMYENGRKTSFTPPDMVWGAVASVTKDSIELWTEKGKPAVMYPAHVYLAAGSIHRLAGIGLGNGYRLQDIKVGDVVEIGIHKEFDTTYCVEIRLRKRPGDLLPPETTRMATLNSDWHHYQNALHDFLDRDIPLPDKWRKTSILKDGDIVTLRGPEADDEIRKKHAHEKGLPDYHPDAEKWESINKKMREKLKASAIPKTVPDTIPKSK
jgi:hypothetical protein